MNRPLTPPVERDPVYPAPVFSVVAVGQLWFACEMSVAHNASVSRRAFLFSLSAALAALLCLTGIAKVSAAQTVGTNTNAVRVACVGDSITFGYGIKDRARDSYPAQLGHRLGAGWDVRNFGHSGATLLHKGNLPYFKQKEHAEALAFKPDVVVILLGANDSKHRGPGSLEAANALDIWQYKADFVPNYEELIAEFRHANPAAKIFVCLPTPCFPGRWGINNGTIHDEIIPLVREVAKATGAGVIDLNTPLAEQGKLFPDTVHPNAAGARLMAETVEQALTGKTAAQ